MKTTEELIGILDKIYEDEILDYQRIKDNYYDELDKLRNDLMDLQIKITTLKIQLRSYFYPNEFKEIQEEIEQLQASYEWKDVPIR